MPHLFILTKTATLVPAFVVEDLPLDRTATLIPAFAMEDLPLGRTLMMMMMTINDDDDNILRYAFRGFRF